MVRLSNTGVVGAVNRLGPLNRNDRNALLPDDFGSPWAFDNANVLNPSPGGAAQERETQNDSEYSHTDSRLAGNLMVVPVNGLYKCLN
jgi:hypothetical protein